MVEPISDSMLIAYDGSDEAERTLAYAGKLLRVKKAYILTAWEPLQRTAARTAGAFGMVQPDWDTTTEDSDPAYGEAVRICREGAQVTAEAGFVAKPYLVETETTIWSTIADTAHDLDAGVIISDTRGMIDLRGLFTASIFDALLKNAGRPALIVPGGKE